MSFRNAAIMSACLAIALSFGLLGAGVVVAAPATTGQSQGTSEQRAACTDDAFRLCGQDIPDEAKVEACLRRHLRDLTPACRSMFTQPEPRRPAR